MKFVRSNSYKCYIQDNECHRSTVGTCRLTNGERDYEWVLLSFIFREILLTKFGKLLLFLLLNLILKYLHVSI